LRLRRLRDTAVKEPEGTGLARKLEHPAQYGLDSRLIQKSE
jgi:hypothetical protein